MNFVDKYSANFNYDSNKMGPSSKLTLNEGQYIFMDASQLNTRKLITQIYYKTYFKWNKNNRTQGSELIFVTNHQETH